MRSLERHDTVDRSIERLVERHDDGRILPHLDRFISRRHRDDARRREIHRTEPALECLERTTAEDVRDRGRHTHRELARIRQRPLKGRRQSIGRQRHAQRHVRRSVLHGDGSVQGGHRVAELDLDGAIDRDLLRAVRWIDGEHLNRGLVEHDRPDIERRIGKAQSFETRDAPR